MASDESNIIRVIKNRDNPYTMINREGFEDERLSWEARGVLGYLLVKPDNWVIRFWDLVNRYAGCGRDKMRRILGELEAAGYLWRERTNDQDGRIMWVNRIYECPDLNPHRSDDTSRRLSRPKVVQATIDGFSGHGESPASTIDALAVGGSPTDGSPTDGSPTDGSPTPIGISKSTNIESENNEIESIEHTPGESAAVGAPALSSWDRVLESLRSDGVAVDMWLQESRAVSLEDGVLVVGVRSAYAKDWAENRLYVKIRRAAEAVYGRSITPRFIISRNPVEKARHATR